MTPFPLTADLVRKVRERAVNVCEYCRLPQSSQEASFHVDHIIPRHAAGSTHPDNLALARVTCSLKKAARTHAVDHQSEEQAPIFNPRRQTWNEQFVWTPDWHVQGLTPNAIYFSDSPPRSLSAWGDVHNQTWSRTSPRHLAACLRGAMFTTRLGLGQAHATSQLVCVGRCSQPDVGLGQAHATSQLVCVERCSQPDLVSDKPTPPRSLSAWSGVHNQTSSRTSPRHLAACLRGAMFPRVFASND